MSLTVERPFSFSAMEHGRKAMTTPESSPVPTPKPQDTPKGRVPRITRLMALAIKFDGYIRDGLVTDYAELARLGHVSRARITQIMDLTLLAPDIQEAILELPRTVKGRDAIRERAVRQLLQHLHWHAQNEAWKNIIAS